MSALKDIYKAKRSAQVAQVATGSKRVERDPEPSSVGLTPIIISEQQESALSIFYSELDSDTAYYLKAKEYEIIKFGNSYLTEMGKVFKEIQGELSNNKNGTFGKWIEAIGFGKTGVYELITRYEYIVRNPNNINLIESLPTSLANEICKPSAPKQLVQAVLDGDITKNKDYQSALAKIRAEEKAKYDELLEEKNSEVEKLQEKLEAISDEKAELSEKFKKIKSKYETKLQEILDSKVEESEEYKQIQEVAETLKNDLKKTESELKKVNSDLRNINLTKKELEDLEDKKDDLLKEIESLNNDKTIVKKFYELNNRWDDAVVSGEKFIREKLLGIMDGTQNYRITGERFDRVFSMVDKLDEFVQAMNMYRDNVNKL